MTTNRQDVTITTGEYEGEPLGRQEFGFQLTVNLSSTYLHQSYSRYTKKDGHAMGGGGETKVKNGLGNFRKQQSSR